MLLFLQKFLKKSLITSIQLKFIFAVIWYFVSILPIISLGDLTTAATSHLLLITLLVRLVILTSPLRNMAMNRKLKYQISLGFMKSKRTLNQRNSKKNSITNSKTTRNKLKIKIVNILLIINKSSNNLNINLRITIIRILIILIKMCLSLSINLSLGTTIKPSLAK